MNSILVVDDEADIRKSLRGVLEDEGYKVGTADTGEACLDILSSRSYDVVLLDIWLPGIDGLETLERVKQHEDGPEVIIISGHGTIETAVRATKLGAFDFIEKPLSLERMLIIVKNAMEARRLRGDNREFRKQLQSKSVIVGESVPTKALRQQISLMAPTNGRVLIYGESGTGKELVALAIHNQSLRRDKLFVELNCAAIPEDFIEAELFGFRNSAMTGEGREKTGTFEKADGGTLFLDEVGDMSLKTQSKVLRTLDEQRFTPVGAPRQHDG
jgi:two-component system nitrogen regulation response regulator NtrX